MVQGTTSDAGKSFLVTALCRWFKNQGLSVAPFKPQNMALNSAVTMDGGEIGRAQALQAEAAGVPPHTDMNPVLLKPCSDVGAQVIIHGHAIGNMDAQAFHAFKPQAMQAVLASHQRLQTQHDVVVVEGAGSPAEINLRAGDIANMGFAEAVDCPVILIADIDRGGVFAHLVGTLALLSESERARVKGMVINRFRGDIALLQSGIDWLEKRTGIPVLGVLPYVQGLWLDAEDALPKQASPATADGNSLNVIIPALPRISNHTDMDPLRQHPQVRVQFIGPDQAIPAADLIVLPGSKSVRDDLAWLKQQGWDAAIGKHLRYGGKVMGICGGFQMLGQSINDPHGVEGKAGSSEGLGLLDLHTTLDEQKTLRQTQGTLPLNAAPCPVRGYEIHAGISTGTALNQPLLQLDDGSDGAISDDGQVIGTYLHGLFDEPQACTALLRWAGLSDAKTHDVANQREDTLNALADLLDAHLDMLLVQAIMRQN